MTSATRVNAQETMVHAAWSVSVGPHNVATGVDPVGAGDRSAGEIDRSEFAILVFVSFLAPQQKAVGPNDGIRTRCHIGVTAYDVAAGVDTQSDGAGRAWEVNRRELTIVQQKTMVVIIGTSVSPYDVSGTVDPECQRENGAGDIK